MRMWEVIQQLCPGAQPTRMLMNFERAAINSFSHFWLHTTVKGCFFHFTQNIFRKIQAEGLQNEYQQNENFAMQMKLLPALSFASPYDIPNLFADMVQQLPMPAAEGLVLYFERTYIGRFFPSGTFQQPLFPIPMWNYHHEVLVGFLRTTNSVEFIQSLKLEQGIVEI